MSLRPPCFCAMNFILWRKPLKFISSFVHTMHLTFGTDTNRNQIASLLLVMQNLSIKFSRNSFSNIERTDLSFCAAQ